MEYIETEIQGVYIIKPKVFFDARGYFYEAWKQDEFEQNVGKINFVQDNESKSGYGFWNKSEHRTSGNPANDVIEFKPKFTKQANL